MTGGTKSVLGRVRRRSRRMAAAALPPVAAAGLRRVRRTIRQLGTEPDAPVARTVVSVVVPVYNVVDYVEECLRSILDQTYRDLEVIVVDDGSTDGSSDVVARLAATDPRIVVVRQANAGLGAARNTGIAKAGGRFLRFVDSDDVLPPDSIAVMVSTISRTGSDFVVGNLSRMTSTRSWVPNWAQDVHRVDRLRCRLRDFPDVLKDVFAHNKLFDAEFFRRVVGSFPQAVRYEDQEPTAKAYVHGTFDILRTVVYHWREREDGTSITQQKTDPADLRDRLEVKQRVARVISSSADTKVVSSWLAKAVGFDLRPYYEQVPRTDLEFWALLRDGVRSIADQLDARAWRQVPMIDRLLALATVEDRRDDVVALLVQRDDYGWRFPGVVRDGAPQLGPGYLATVGLDPDPALLRIRTAEIRLVRRLTGARWDGSTLILEGHAYLTGIDLADTGSVVEVVLLSTLTGRQVQVPLVRRSDPYLDVDSGDSWNSYADSAFTATLDLGEGSVLLTPPPAEETWHLRVRVSVGDLALEVALVDLDPRGPLRRLPVGAFAPSGHWLLVPDKTAGLGLRHRATPTLRVESVDCRDEEVEIVVSGWGPDWLRVAPGAKPRETAAGRVLQVAPEPLDGTRTRFRFRLPRSEPRAAVEEWSLRVGYGPTTHRLFWPHGSAALGEAFGDPAVVVPLCSREGALRLRQGAWQVVADRVELETAHAEDGSAQERLLVSGATVGLEGSGCALQLEEATGRSTPATELVRDGRRFSVSLPLHDQTGEPLTSGTFRLRALRTDDDGTLRRDVAIADVLLADFPVERSTERSAVTVVAAPDGLPRVKFRRPYRVDERGRLAQRRLHQLFTPSEAVPLQPGVVFECFNGKTFGDSGLALFRELRRRHPDWRYFWSVAEATSSVPEGSQPLLRHSRAWTEAVRSSTHLVNNSNFPAYFRKQPGQVYLQTWHGTPLKRIGNDMPKATLSLSYRNLMVHEAAAWDWLLAQNPFAAEIFPTAFGYDGPVLTTGYPRNDSLHAGDEERARIRESLGLPPDRLVVLYAPTWRENVRTAGRGYALVSYLDVDEVAERLGEVTVLLRGHANTSAPGSRGEHVLDVTRHPDINELMVAADVLVTDYSSVMFDFCVTGRPILLLTPDLELYRDTTRGFYLPLEQIAPGPVCMTSTELVAELAELEHYAERYADRYAAFRTRFAPDDDGEAARRVVDRVWGD